MSAGKSLYSDLANNPSRAISDIKTGYGISYAELAAKGYYEQGKAVGNFFGQIEVAVAVAKIGSEVGSKINSPVIKEPYSRPLNATTSVQKGSVQGFPCTTCGQMAPKMFADHKNPLVKEYYETGKIDLNRMRDIKSVQPQCPTCSNKQGGELSNYSKQMKQKYGF